MCPCVCLCVCVRVSAWMEMSRVICFVYTGATCVHFICQFLHSCGGGVIDLFNWVYFFAYA